MSTKSTTRVQSKEKIYLQLSFDSLINGVLDKHCHGHWTHTTRHRGNVTSNLFCTFELNVAKQFTLSINQLLYVDTTVDHHGAWLDPITLINDSRNK